VARGLEHADKRRRIAAVEIAVAADRVLAHLVDIVVGVKQGDTILARCDRRLQGEIAVQSPANQFGFEGIVALRAKRMAVLESIVGKCLA